MEKAPAHAQQYTSSKQTFVLLSVSIILENWRLSFRIQITATKNDTSSNKMIDGSYKKSEKQTGYY